MTDIAGTALGSNPPYQGWPKAALPRPWARFFSDLTVHRIKNAEELLRRSFECDRFDGKTFLDVDCGNGLFSLAARRLGACVCSFDKDQGAVECAGELRRRYFGDDDSAWVVKQGSILDSGFLESLGKFDLVYAPAGLCRSGDVWLAFAGSKRLLTPGGALVFSTTDIRDPNHGLAEIDEVTVFFAQDGFRLCHFVPNGQLGSKELLFRRDGDPGAWLEPSCRTLASLARWGYRLAEPYRRDQLGMTGTLPDLPPRTAGSLLWLLCNGKPVGEVRLLPGYRIRIPGAIEIDDTARCAYQVVAVEEFCVNGPFKPDGGNMWRAALPHAGRDESGGTDLVLLENRQPTASSRAPQTTADEQHGSDSAHSWHELIFATRDSTDPNTNGRRYSVLIPISRQRFCCSKRWGRNVDGPFSYSREGWFGAIASDVSPPRGTEYYLFRDGDLVGQVTPDGTGRIRVAGPEEPWGAVHGSRYDVVAGRFKSLLRPFRYARRHMRKAALHELTALLAELRENASGRLSLLEEGRELPFPDASKHEIAANGHGRWMLEGNVVWFSSSDGSDPDDNQKSYAVFVVGHAGGGTGPATELSRECGVFFEDDPRMTQLRAVVDADWYLATYPDIVAHKIEPVVHYLLFGAAEGRNPNTDFDTRTYLALRTDAATRRINPLVHFLFSEEIDCANEVSEFSLSRDAQAELIRRSGGFDPDWYLDRNPDVAAVGMDPLLHYLDCGAAEGRDPAPRFNAALYLAIYPEVAATRISPLAHYARSRRV